MHEGWNLVVFLVCVAACKRSPPAPSITRGPDAAPPAPALRELLHSVPSVVAVSSVVANPRHRARDLVDQDMQSAWNSRTGDLTGAWMAFRVPSSTRIREVRLTVGFARSAVIRDGGRTEDAFRSNVRINKVRVSRWDTSTDAGLTVIGDFALDPDNRGLQTIALDVPGGDYKVEVLGWVSGTNPRWQEICVSELEVWGTSGIDAGAAIPVVRVGALDVSADASVDLERLDGPHKTLGAFCKAHKAKVAPEIAQRKDAGAYDPSAQDNPVVLVATPAPERCEASAERWAVNALPAGTSLFRVRIDTADETTLHLVIKTPAGVFVGPALDRSHYLVSGDPEECTSTHAADDYPSSSAFKDGLLVVTAIHTLRAYHCDENLIWGDHDAAVNHETNTHSGTAQSIVCRFEADVPACGTLETDLTPADPSKPITARDPEITLGEGGTLIVGKPARVSGRILQGEVKPIGP